MRNANAFDTPPAGRHDAMLDAGTSSRGLFSVRQRTTASGRYSAVMADSSFRLRAIMRQGTAAGVPETWEHYASIDDARAAAKNMYHDDRVLRIMLVLDSAGSFVDWIDR
jgi:hypothetical protein